MEELTITKRISKMGDNIILIIPKDLKGQIDANDLVEARLKIISKGNKSYSVSKKKSTSTPKNTKKPVEKILGIVRHLKDQGYDLDSIRAVMKKNGYKSSDVDVAIKSIK